MSLIDLTRHFKRNPWLTQEWVGPLSARDVFYLFKIREAAKEYLADNPEQMDSFGYTLDHHAEFMAQFHEINDQMFKAYDTEEPQPLPLETARGLRYNIHSIISFIQTTQIPLLEELFSEAEQNYTLSTKAPRLRPLAAWTKFDEQEKRNREYRFRKDTLEEIQEILLNACRIESTLESFCNRADIGAEVIPLHQDNSPT